jgi:hypothetical protein
MNWIQIGDILIPLTSIGAGLIVMSGVYRLASKALDRRGGAALGAGAEERIDQLQDEIERLREEHSGQLEEVHERLDFAERLLANPGKES